LPNRLETELAINYRTAQQIVAAAAEHRQRQLAAAS